MDTNRNRGLTANQLKLLALGFMLLDHMWATIIPGNLWMTCVGRLAFPIFAFQATEGYAHTRNRKAYCKRLLLFGLLSELPFNLMVSGGLLYPFHQNVMFTLALGLCAIHWCEQSRTAPTAGGRTKAVLAAMGCILLASLAFTDYGAAGVCTILLFWACRTVGWGRLGQLAGMAALHIFGVEGMQLEFSLLGRTLYFPVQGFAVLALGLIWLYNGQKGRSSKALQYGAYLFYPAHMLVLYLLWRLM